MSERESKTGGSGEAHHSAESADAHAKREHRPGKGEAKRRTGRHSSPRHSDEQDSPEPERPTRPDEEAGQSIEELEDPPQAEGTRE